MEAIMIRRVTTILLCALLTPFAALAQDTRALGSDTPHRFFDATNIALTVAESGALLADGITTQQARTKYPEFFHEADPIARPFVERGWPGQIVGGALFVTADVGLRYWLHRTNHHRVERFLPMVLTTYGTVCAILNAHTLRQFERNRQVSVIIRVAP